LCNILCLPPELAFRDNKRSYVLPDMLEEGVCRINLIRDMDPRIRLTPSRSTKGEGDALARPQDDP